MIGTKHLKGGLKLGLDFTQIELSNNHKAHLRANTNQLAELRQALIWAERDGRYSAAKKLRRAINQHLEQELYLSHSWCGSCHQVLHNCQCKEN